jgi:hypothetical protein
MAEPTTILTTVAKVLGPPVARRVVEWARGSEARQLVELLRDEHPAAAHMLTQPDALGELWWYAETGDLRTEAMVKAVRPLTASDEEARALVEAIRVMQWRVMRDERRSHFEFLRLRQEIAEDLRGGQEAMVARLDEAVRRFARALPVVRQLPAQTSPFADRAEELAQAEHLLWERPGGQVAVVIAVSGMAGIGKSSLALELAHRHAAGFEGGILYVDMRSADGSVRRAPDVAARLLRDLGIAPDAIPQEADARVAALRSLLAQEAVLLVLDNASDAEQVRDLIPANRDSVVIVTSRASLGALGAARLLDLHELEEQDGLIVLEAIVGKSVETAAAMAVVKSCGGLPLALAVAAGRVRRGTPLEELATNAARTADVLGAVDDAAGSVRATLSSALDATGPEARRLALLVATLTVGDIDPEVAAAIADYGRDHAARLLEELEGQRLLTRVEGGSKRQMHELLRRVAAELATAELGEEEIASAEERRVQWLVTSAREYSGDLADEG